FLSPGTTGPAVYLSNARDSASANCAAGDFAPRRDSPPYCSASRGVWVRPVGSAAGLNDSRSSLASASSSSAVEPISRFACAGVNPYLAPISRRSARSSASWARRSVADSRSVSFSTSVLPASCSSRYFSASGSSSLSRRRRFAASELALAIFSRERFSSNGSSAVLSVASVASWASSTGSVLSSDMGVRPPGSSGTERPHHQGGEASLDAVAFGVGAAERAHFVLAGVRAGDLVPELLKLFGPARPLVGVAVHELDRASTVVVPARVGARRLAGLIHRPAAREHRTPIARVTVGDPRPSERVPVGLHRLECRLSAAVEDVAGHDTGGRVRRFTASLTHDQP